MPIFDFYHFLDLEFLMEMNLFRFRKWFGPISNHDFTPKTFLKVFVLFFDKTFYPFLKSPLLGCSSKYRILWMKFCHLLKMTNLNANRHFSHFVDQAICQLFVNRRDELSCYENGLFFLLSTTFISFQFFSELCFKRIMYFLEIFLHPF